MPTLILLPGMDGTGRLFAAFEHALGLAARVRVIAYPNDEPLGYDALIEFVLRALPPDEPFFLLGESFSGPVAIRIAAMRKHRLMGLILCCTFARSPLPAWMGGRHLAGIAPFNYVPLSLMSHLLLGRFASSALRDAIAQAVAMAAPAVMRARARAVMSVDASADLQQVQVPIVYLRATEDRVVPASASAYMQACAPDMQMNEVVAPHCLLQAAPVQAAAIVAAFLSKLAAPGS